MANDSIVLDASAVLVYLQGERGEDVVEAALDLGPCYISTVNVSEVLGKLRDLGMPMAEAVSSFDELGLLTIDFDADLARRAADLRQKTKPIGASIGDRACLALADRLSQSSPTSVFTADAGWASLKWQFKVKLVRSPRMK